MSYLHSLTFRTADIPHPLGHDHDCPMKPAGSSARPRLDRGMPMPETPAQDLLTLPKTTSASQTERMATPEELYALKRIAEVENAIAALAKKELDSETERQLTIVKPENAAAPNSPNITLSASAATPVNVAASVSVITETAPEAGRHADSESASAKFFAGSGDSGLLELASILDQHRIWVESGGEAGTKADLCGANLEN